MVAVWELEVEWLDSAGDLFLADAVVGAEEGLAAVPGFDYGFFEVAEGFFFFVGAEGGLRGAGGRDGLVAYDCGLVGFDAGFGREEVMGGYGYWRLVGSEDGADLGRYVVSG